MGARRVAAVTVGLWLVLLATASIAFAAPPAGPPFPAPITGQRVYDNAGIFSLAAIQRAEQTSRAIEERTGAQVVVYTQVKPESDNLDKVTADAAALMERWGVGRKGFDDGLVIFFDMQDNLQHGQVTLDAGDGFRAAFLTNAQRQAIFDGDMKPLLVDGQFDAALDVAMQQIDAAATPEHAAALEQARQINALVGLGALVLAVALFALAIGWWARHGRDPVYIDDNSVLMPAPPPDLTPAMATLLMDDRTSPRTVSAGLVDLAAHGAISFVDQSVGPLHKAGIDAPAADPKPMTTPESTLAAAIRGEVATNAGYLEPKELPVLAGPIKGFKANLEADAVLQGWLAGKPSNVVARWVALGIVEIVAGAALIWWTLQSDASGGLLGGVPLIVCGIVTCIAGYFMPARTRMGAMLNAMLHAYKRTLQKTMEMAQSMGEVVDRKPLPWVTTPDETMAWGVAFGLQHEIDGVLRRGFEQAQRSGSPATAWYPVWWSSPEGHGSGGFAGGAAGGGGGMFSPSAMPDVGGMVAALGTVGASAGHSGGGGFGGGGGGAGGGAGGGF